LVVVFHRVRGAPQYDLSSMQLAFFELRRSGREEDVDLPTGGNFNRLLILLQAVEAELDGPGNRGRPGPLAPNAGADLCRRPMLGVTTRWFGCSERDFVNFRGRQAIDERGKPGRGARLDLCVLVKAVSGLIGIPRGARQIRKDVDNAEGP